ncbi:MAG: hypothetical protein HYW77_02750 [Parcubacteria group bacterium]|nr:hypothetical protein [Parcubacteria group bacterium]
MISDVFVVSHLLQNTQSNNVFWHRNEDGPYITKLHENTERQVDIWLYLVQSRGLGEIIYLRFTSLELRKKGKLDILVLSEPQTKGFSRKYNNEDEAQLVQLLKQLYKVVCSQCAKREILSQQDEELLKQEVYAQILNPEK